LSLSTKLCTYSNACTCSFHWCVHTWNQV